MTRPAIEPGQVWFVDLDPVRGREQGKDRPALVVSSRFHLDLTMAQLATVLPLTSVERRGWLHRVHVSSGSGWVITEQIRTVTTERFRRHAPEIALSRDELDEVRRALAQMLIG
ncbi:MAG: type II toxin-antitoxin system PemK/MazF family toxin [Actinomycetota bacterium]|nr:type II toxin-antitoxin system PemK/MazF family toxin [Actinomycetota bacterium]